MKLVKATQLGITTSLNGVLYNIGAEAIIVTDEVASALKEQFLHLVEITDIEVQPEEVIIPEVQPEEVIVTPQIEEKPKKKGRTIKDSNI